MNNIREGTENEEMIVGQGLWGTSCAKATHLKVQAIGDLDVKHLNYS